MSQQHIEDYFEDKAREGDGQFAIAWALIQTTKMTHLSDAIRRLGFAYADNAKGAIEEMGILYKEHTEEFHSILNRIATALDSKE